ncbi:hypothetical protein BG842_07985 [Haladaptatus sp. W1]|uniref:hypothetical protein n=1 Tax=Haladaptatus sp. W1 TaxID=1897478 RepID=UPI000849BBC1|nr:hypothetical protein [Haladaptatus sp. W1]ODR79750.1 hypothetical protein BG842_07985 [Haladaptatus sp. W1]
MFAEGVAVDVVRAGASHQVVGHVVDGDHVLMVCRVLVALGGDVDESRGIDIEGKSIQYWMTWRRSNGIEPSIGRYNQNSWKYKWLQYTDSFTQLPFAWRANQPGSTSRGSSPEHDIYRLAYSPIP